MVFPTMTTPQTPPGPMKLTVDVEESRAQRQKRQQSRFRDRGGIFVPMTRSTLADILMGRRAASPKKSLRRSASPTKRDRKSEEAANSQRPASPAKSPRKGRVSGYSKLSSGQVQNNGKPVAEARATPPTFVGSGNTKKQRKQRTTRTPKVLDGAQEKAVSPKKVTKSKPTTRKRGARSKSSEKSASQRQPAPVKMDKRSVVKLPMIPEQIEVDEERDETVRTEDVTKGKQKAQNVEDDADSSMDKNTKPPAPKPKVNTSKPTGARASKCEEEGVCEAAIKADSKAKPIRRSKAIAKPQKESPEEATGYKEPVLKISAPSKAAATTLRKRQVSNGNHSDDEALDPSSKRVSCIKESRQQDDKVIACNAPMKEPESSFPAVSGAELKKRTRKPEDWVSGKHPPLKRVKVDECVANVEKGTQLLREDAKVADSRNALVAEVKVGSRAKRKENAVAVKKSAKPAKNDAKVRKRAKGLPERVLQRLKNSVPHTMDDEPDPIDFLS